VRVAALRPGAHAAAWRTACVLLLLGSVTLAHAGLFDDEEARKAIVDLKARVAAAEEAAKARGAEMAVANAQLAEQLAALRRSLLDLNGQIELLRGDVAKLRGSDEQLLRDLAEVQRRQKDIGQSLDDRLRRLEPVKVAIDGREAMVEPDEKRAYDEALATIRGGDFDKSAALLLGFQRRYPASPYIDSTRFWLGNALYGKRDYKEAVNVFRSFVASAADHPRAPDALLALANSQAEMKDSKAARKTIEELMKAYPQSEAAKDGKERLALLK
jgi:tol-pal system protein YbgF